MKNIFTIEEDGVLQIDCYSNKLMLYNGICKSFPGFKQHKHELMFDVHSYSYDITNTFFKKDFTYPRLLALCSTFIKEKQPIEFHVIAKDSSVDKYGYKDIKIKQLNIISKVSKTKRKVNETKQINTRSQKMV